MADGNPPPHGWQPPHGGPPGPHPAPYGSPQSPYGTPQSPYGAPQPPYGTPPGWQPNQPPKQPWYRSGCGIAALIVGGLGALAVFGFVVLVIIVVIADAGGPRVDAAPTDKGEYREVTEREYKQIAKDPGEHEGERIILYGVITQADDITGDKALRASTGAEPTLFDWDYDVNAVLAVEDGTILEDVVEDDRVKLWVEVAGDFSYETELGGELTVPLLSVGVLEVTDEDE